MGGVLGSDPGGKQREDDEYNDQYDPNRRQRTATGGARKRDGEGGHADLCLVEAGERKLPLVLLHQLLEALERGYFCKRCSRRLGGRFYARSSRRFLRQASIQANRFHNSGHV